MPVTWNKSWRRSRQRTLHLKPANCVWGVKEILFPGFTTVAGKGITMSRDKMLKISSLAPPRNVRGVWEALRLINFYGHFIPHCSDICAPINALSGKDIARSLPPPALPLGLPCLPLLAGCVSRRAPLGTANHHKFCAHEKNWGIHDKELRATVYAFDTFRQFLAQPRFPISVISDHWNLSKFMFTTGLLKPQDGRGGLGEPPSPRPASASSTAQGTKKSSPTSCRGTSGG